MSAGLMLAMSPWMTWPTFSSTVIFLSSDATFSSSASSLSNGHFGDGQISGWTAAGSSALATGAAFSFAASLHPSINRKSTMARHRLRSLARFQPASSEGWNMPAGRHLVEAAVDRDARRVPPVQEHLRRARVPVPPQDQGADPGRGGAPGQFRGSPMARSGRSARSGLASGCRRTCWAVSCATASLKLIRSK